MQKKKRASSFEESNQEFSSNDESEQRSLMDMLKIQNHQMRLKKKLTFRRGIKRTINWFILFHSLTVNYA